MILFLFLMLTCGPTENAYMASSVLTPLCSQKTQASSLGPEVCVYRGACHVRFVLVELHLDNTDGTRNSFCIFQSITETLCPPKVCNKKQSDIK